MQEGVKLDVLLTKFIAEELNTAGYNVVVQDAQSSAPNSAKYDAIVTGDISEFWGDVPMMKVGNKLDMSIKALNPASQTVVWEKRIETAEVSMLWVGAKGEFERVITVALTKALDQAAQAFASDEFSKAIRR